MYIHIYLYGGTHNDGAGGRGESQQPRHQSSQKARKAISNENATCLVSHFLSAKRAEISAGPNTPSSEAQKWPRNTENCSSGWEWGKQLYEVWLGGGGGPSEVENERNPTVMNNVFGGTHNFSESFFRLL